MSKRAKKISIVELYNLMKKMEAQMMHIAQMVSGIGDYVGHQWNKELTAANMTAEKAGWLKEDNDEEEKEAAGGGTD